MNQLRPVESEIKKIDSNFVLFDYTNKLMYLFSLETKLVDKKSLTLLKGMKPAIYIDYDFHTLIFSKINSNGVLTLYKYDRIKDKLTHHFELKDFYFINSFKIKEKHVFFIGKDRSSSDLTKRKIIKQLIRWESI
jgi:hypothetical protein